MSSSKDASPSKRQTTLRYIQHFPHFHCTYLANPNDSFGGVKPAAKQTSMSAFLSGSQEKKAERKLAETSNEMDVDTVKVKESNVNGEYVGRAIDNVTKTKTPLRCKKTETTQQNC